MRRAERIERLIDRYWRWRCAWDIASSLGKIEAHNGSSISDDHLARLVEMAHEWDYLAPFAEDLRLLVNQYRAKGFRSRTKKLRTRIGPLAVADVGEVYALSQEQLAKIEGLTVEQYRERLKLARKRIDEAICSA